MYRSLLILSISFLATVSSTSAQRKEFRRFQEENCGNGATFRIGLSFLPLRVVSWFIPKTAFDGDAADIKWALKKVRRVRCYTIVKGDMEGASVDLLKEDLFTNKKYEPLMELRKEGAHVELLSKGKTEDRLDNLIVLLKKEDNFVMVHVRTRITMKDLNQLINRLQYDHVIAKN